MPSNPLPPTINCVSHPDWIASERGQNEPRQLSEQEIADIQAIVESQLWQDKFKQLNGVDWDWEASDSLQSLVQQDPSLENALRLVFHKAGLPADLDIDLDDLPGKRVGQQ